MLERSVKSRTVNEHDSTTLLIALEVSFAFAGEILHRVSQFTKDGTQFAKVRQCQKFWIG